MGNRRAEKAIRAFPSVSTMGVMRLDAAMPVSSLLLTSLNIDTLGSPAAFPLQSLCRVMDYKFRSFVKLIEGDDLGRTEVFSEKLEGPKLFLVDTMLARELAEVADHKV